ncbi:hypothetical protein [Crocinitomix algicola]|uniref:hypothetical protein n=1 Tax=Crocinitomix algicola TaxID=1740263 RepID=UPI000836A45C|nr:hypothetical protein [Crocinitomix algicola]
MSKKSKRKFKFIWQNIILPFTVLVGLFLSIFYLTTIISGVGYKSVMFALILMFSFLIGCSHVLIYFLRRAYENEFSKEIRKKKRRLELFRNTVNYMTPFVLLAMLYHFWQRDWFSACVIVLVLLFDRMHELIRVNK